MAKAKSITKVHPRSGDAWGYIRVSTLRQANSGLSLEEQKLAIERYCEHHQLNLKGIFEDPAVSGGSEFASRPGGSKLILAAKRGDTVICKNFARAFRNTIDACTMAQQWYEVDGVYLVLLDMGGIAVDYATPMGRFVFTIMAATMAYEREARGEQTREIYAMRRAQGFIWQPSDAPLGKKWMFNGSRNQVKLVKCEETWEQMRLIYQMQVELGLTVEQLLPHTRRLPRLHTLKKIEARRDGKKIYRIAKTRLDWRRVTVLKALKMVAEEIAQQQEDEDKNQEKKGESA